jgi:hypothetical protein
VYADEFRRPVLLPALRRLRPVWLPPVLFDVSVLPTVERLRLNLLWQRLLFGLLLAVLRLRRPLRRDGLRRFADVRDVVGLLRFLRPLVLQHRLL